MKYIYSFSDVNESNIMLSGGKGSSLVKMTKEGFPVPYGYVILSNAFSNRNINIDALKEINEFIDLLSDKCKYAVRSSGIGEDGEKFSFAGAYETVLDVKKSEILNAVKTVIASTDSVRVNEYVKNRRPKICDMAVVIQEFVKPQLAGVLFTANPITKNSSEMIGNYVYGVGEALVSGESDAYNFNIDILKKNIKCDKAFMTYAKKLYKYGIKIKKLYNCEMDIEWAVKNKKIYILQARPITTLNRINKDSFDINSSRSGNYLFLNTNVGEALPRVISPMQWSLLEIINNTLGLPHFIDNICGHPYANMSVIYSALKSFGLSNKRIKKLTGDIAGDIPKDIKVPVFPYDKKILIHAVFNLLKKPPKGKYSNISKKYFFENCEEIMFEAFSTIEKADTNNKLKYVYDKEVMAYVRRLLSCMLKYGKISGLFNFREELSEIVSQESANALCSNCSIDGILESMKISLFIEKAAKNEISKKEYLKLYGHRCPDELEVAAPRPYEIENYVENLVSDYNKNNISTAKLLDIQKEKYNEARAEFIQKYPKKVKWLDKNLTKFKKSEMARELVRSKGVLLVCIMRKFLLQCGRVNNIYDDIFYLYFDEAKRLIKGDKSSLCFIKDRKLNYEKYKALPALPTAILGEFDCVSFIKDENRNIEFYNQNNKNTISDAQDKNIISGFSGASGIVEGTVHILNNFSEFNEFIMGEILVTSMTNIGWTPLFPKAAAIITDIGAPLSHAAIVAREFGIPAVVGCKNATVRLKTGDRVRVDGGKGMVYII